MTKNDEGIGDCMNEKIKEITDAREFLAALKCTNDIKEIKSFDVIYKNSVEISYSLETELGELCARIVRMPDAYNASSMINVSILDYFNCNYKFNRNVNLPCRVNLTKEAAQQKIQMRKSRR